MFPYILSLPLCQCCAGESKDVHTTCVDNGGSVNTNLMSLTYNSHN